MKSKDKHVIPKQHGRWAVRSTGRSRAARVFDDKDQAVKYAKSIAQKDHGELYVHGKDGTIKERRSYAKASALPKDKKS